MLSQHKRICLTAKIPTDTSKRTLNINTARKFMVLKELLLYKKGKGDDSRLDMLIYTRKESKPVTKITQQSGSRSFGIQICRRTRWNKISFENLGHSGKV